MTIARAKLSSEYSICARSIDDTNVNTIASLPNPFLESQAKATEGNAGMAGVTGAVRRSTAGTGLRVGESGVDLTATSEFMDVTAGETATNSDGLDIPDFLRRARIEPECPSRVTSKENQNIQETQQ